MKGNSNDRLPEGVDPRDLSIFTVLARTFGRSVGSTDGWWVPLDTGFCIINLQKTWATCWVRVHFRHFIFHILIFHIWMINFLKYTLRSRRLFLTHFARSSNSNISNVKEQAILDANFLSLVLSLCTHYLILYLN